MKVAAVSITSKAACTIDMGFIRVVCSLLDFVRWIRFDVAYVLHPPGAEALYTASNIRVVDKFAVTDPKV